MNKIAVNIGNIFNSPFSRDKTVGNLMGLILNTSFTLAGLAILFLLIFSGFSIITGAGNNNPERVEKGKKTATAAIIGLVVVFGAYWLIRIIEIMFGKNFITEPNF